MGVPPSKAGEEKRPPSQSSPADGGRGHHPRSTALSVEGEGSGWGSTENMAAAGARLAGLADVGHVTGDRALEEGACVDHRADPADDRKPAPDELSLVAQLGAAVHVGERELLECAVERAVDVPKRDAVRRVQRNLLQRRVGEQPGLGPELDRQPVAVLETSLDESPALSLLCLRPNEVIIWKTSSRGAFTSTRRRDSSMGRAIRVSRRRGPGPRTLRSSPRP